MSEQQIKDQAVNWTQLYILRAIANGHEHERNIRRIVNVTANTLRQQLRELRSKGFIEKTGPILGSWKLTEEGVNTLALYGWEPTIPQRNAQKPIQRSETRITTTFGTAFKASFAAVFGIFIAIIAVGAVASITYWVGYNLIIKNYVPPKLLPYIPLDNPLIAIILGLLTSIALFIPLRTWLSSGLMGR